MGSPLHNARVDRAMGKADYEPVGTISGFNFATRDGTAVANVTSPIRGIRDLNAAIIALAIVVDQNPHIRRASLIVLDHRMRLETIGAEWTNASHALRPNLRTRLELVAINRRGTTVLPSDRPPLLRLATALQALSPGKAGESAGMRGSRRGRSSLPVESHARPSLHYVVLKILLLRYLQRLGPVTNKTLRELAGCSYPTAAKSLQSLRPHLVDHSDRSIELASWPQAAWDELMTLSARIRGTVRFSDTSGEPTDPTKLLARLSRLSSKALAVGGTFAAQHWDRQFDLHGTPRLDLSVHAPSGNPDLGFIGRLDPALRVTTDPGDSVSVAVHTVYRAKCLFAANPASKIAWADPVETLLDLHELRLTKQAAELARCLRTDEDTR